MLRLILQRTAGYRSCTRYSSWSRMNRRGHAIESSKNRAYTGGMGYLVGVGVVFLSPVLGFIALTLVLAGGATAAVSILLAVLAYGLTTEYWVRRRVDMASLLSPAQPAPSAGTRRLPCYGSLHFDVVGRVHWSFGEEENAILGVPFPKLKGTLAVNLGGDVDSRSDDATSVSSPDATHRMSLALQMGAHELPTRLPSLAATREPRIAVANAAPEYGALLRDMIEAGGWSCLVCNETPFASIKDEQPDLILLDVGTHPVESGWHVLSHLTLAPETREIPVLVLTSDEALGTRRAWVQAHGISVLPKPFDLQELYCAVETALLGAHA